MLLELKIFFKILNGIIFSASLELVIIIFVSLFGIVCSNTFFAVLPNSELGDVLSESNMHIAGPSLSF